MNRTYYLLLFSCLLFLVSIPETRAHNRYILTETFIDGSGATPPSRWASVALPGDASGAGWRFDNPQGRSLSFPMVPPVAIFDAGVLPAGTGDAEIALERQSFELRPDWTNNYMLIFDHSLDIDAGVVVKVEVYDGTNWHEAISWSGETITLQRETLDISDFLGETSGRIRFTWSGSVDGDGYWAIDNVRVFAAWEQDAGLVQISSPVMPMEAGMHDLELVIGNFGIQPVSSATILWSFDGGPEQDFYWEDTGNPLLFGQSRGIDLGDINIAEPVMLTIRVELEGDENPDNDAISVKLRPRMDDSQDYTIGGSEPDFATFGEAVQALSLAGISAPVTFYVAEGDYEERVDIGPIDGASATNIISFLSAPPNSSSPSLFTTIEQQAALHIRGASHLRFEGIGFSGHRGVEVEDHAADVAFSDCHFSASEVGMLISGGANDVRVEGSTFRDAALLLSIGEAGTAPVHDINIIDNVFYDAQVRAIHVQDASDVEIGYNRIDDVKFGLSVEGGSDLTIRNNRIHVNATFGQENAGIRLDDITGARVFNNFISSQGLAIATGIRLGQNQDAGIYYNSVHITNTDVTADSKALRIDEGNQGLDVRNNIFNIEEQGYPVYIDAPLAGVTLNHNNYYHPQGRIGWTHNAVQNSLADWQSATGQDADSFDEKPFFAGPTSPDIAQSLLAGEADPILPLNIDQDIEDDPRNNPTIGAREFEDCPNDAGINGIIDPIEQGLPGPVPIKVILKNHGRESLRSVDIFWRINDDHFGPFSWEESIDPLGSIPAFESREVDLFPGNDFSNGVFFNLQVWTNNPNGLGDDGDCNTVNDLFEIDVSVALCGTYTIGGDGSIHPNFKNFSDAVEVLNLAGTACEEVIFIVYPKPGDYREQIMLIDFPVSSPVDSVIFQSEAGHNPARIVYLEHQQSPVRIRGARNIHFRDIIFRGHTPLRIENHANNLSFIGCLFEVSDLASSSTQGVRITNHARNIVFSGNVFQDGFHAINIPPGQGVEVGNIDIIDNDFHSHFHDAIQTHGANQMLIHNNRFHNIRLGVLSGGTNNLTISNNRFYIETDPGQDNINRGILASGGIHIRIYNNFILSKGLGATTGIRISNTVNSGVFFNSINILNNNLQGENHGLSINGGNQIDVRNNIARVSAMGYPLWLQAMPVSLTLNHNNYYHPEGLVGLFNGTEYKSLGAWQVATSQDANSLAVNPFFSGNGGPDVNQAQLINGFDEAGGIIEDIHGEPRINPPTIGAREYTPETIDAGIAGFVSPGRQVLGEETITVILQNHGTSNLELVTIRWEVNGEAQEPFDWPKDGAILTYQDTVHVELGTYPFGSGSYVIRARTDHPDDDNADNDLSELTVYGGLAGEYQIGTDLDFNDVSDAVAALNQAGITGDVTFLLKEDQNMSVVIGDFGRTEDDLTVTLIADKPDGTSVQIQASGGVPFAMKLEEGTRHLYFEDIDFRGPSAVIIDPGTSNIHFDGCSFTATNKEAQAVRIGAGSSDISFQNGGFTGGDHSILLDGQAATPIEQLLIENNQFENTNSQAIRASWVNEMTIRGNHFKDVRSGIRVANSESLLIRENWIAMQASASLTKGIEVAGSSEVRIYNNFVFGTGHGAVWGMDMRNNEQAYIYFNTVNITSSSALSRSIILDEGHTLYIYYNIFSTHRGYPLYIVQLPLDIVLRSNNYHNQSSAQVVYYNQTYLFPAWRDFALNEGIDDQPENFDPEFNPEDSPIPGNEQLRNLAERMDDIRYDIRGARRNPDSPDIGCYESFFDFGVAEIILPEIDCNTNEIDGFHVRLIYSGLEDEDFETPLTVNYQLVGTGLIESKNFPLSREYDEMVVYIPYDIDLSTPGVYELRVWLPDVADMGDEYEGNDSFSKSWKKHSPPEITNIGLTPACDTIRFHAEVSSVDGDDIISSMWFFGDGGQSMLTTDEYSYSTAGTYHPVFQVTTQSGCVVEEVLNLQVGDPDAELNIAEQVFSACGGGSNGEIILTVSGGMAPYFATIDGGEWVDEDHDGSGVFSFTGLAPKNYSFEVRDQMNCRADTDLDVLPVPEVNPRIIPEMEQVNIPADVPFSFIADHPEEIVRLEWSFNGQSTYETDPIFTFDAEGVYTVTLTVYAGPNEECVEEVVHTIEAVLPPLTLDVEIQQQYCHDSSPASVVLQMDGGVPPYTIFVDGTEMVTTSDATWQLPDVQPGNSYEIMIRDTYDQEQSFTAVLVEPISMNPVITAMYETGEPFGDSDSDALPFTLVFSFVSDDQPNNWIWHVGDISSTDPELKYTFEEPGNFDLFLEVFSGEPGHCMETATFTIISELVVEIATVDVFTPNGDGVNDYFEVIHKGLVSLEVDIFDRRGRLVYRFDDLDGKWDGNYQNGRPAPDGLYPFFLRATGYDGVDYERSGVVQLLRDAILVFPNPVSYTFYIDPKGNLSGPVNVDIIDLQANIIKTFRQLEFHDLIELSAAGLQEGLYVIRVSDSSNVFHHKIRVVR